MSADEFGEFENRLRRRALARPAAGLENRVLSAASAASGPSRRTATAPWTALAAAVVAVAASAAINARIDHGGSTPGPAARPATVTMPPLAPGLSPVVVLRPSPAPPADFETIVKQRRQLEALLGS